MLNSQWRRPDLSKPRPWLENDWTPDGNNCIDVPPNLESLECPSRACRSGSVIHCDGHCFCFLGRLSSLRQHAPPGRLRVLWLLGIVQQIYGLELANYIIQTAIYLNILFSTEKLTFILFYYLEFITYLSILHILMPRFLMYAYFDSRFLLNYIFNQYEIFKLVLF